MKQIKLKSSTPFFQDLSDDDKKKYFRKEFEQEGAFSNLFPGKDFVELETRESSVSLRNEILRLLLSKGIIKEKIELEKLHEEVSHAMKSYDLASGVNKVSQLFYENDDEFEKKYLNVIKMLYQNYLKFPFYFQKTPTIRIQCPKAENSNHYPRYHTDIGYGHPPQELNIWMPITKPGNEQKHAFRMIDLKDTRNILNRYNYDFALFINDAVNNKDLSKECDNYSREVATELDKTAVFDARCLHTGEVIENHTRVSMDIRIISVSDYESMRFRFQGAGKRKILFEPGQCYHMSSSDKL